MDHSSKTEAISDQLTAPVTQMSLADWRWAAKRGFWDPVLRCWNEELGGKQAYLTQRDMRREKRKNRKRRTQKASTEFMTCGLSTGEFSLSSDPTLINFMARHAWDQPHSLRYGKHDVQIFLRLDIIYCLG